MRKDNKMCRVVEFDPEEYILTIVALLNCQVQMSISGGAASLISLLLNLLCVCVCVCEIIYFLNAKTRDNF